MSTSRELSIDDLPRYSPWPARLLGVTPWSRPERTREDLLREFEREKWGTLLARVMSSGTRVSLDDVEAWEAASAPESLVTDGDSWLLLPAKEAGARYAAHVAAALSPYKSAPAILELGCGYGGQLLRVAKRPEFSGKRILGGELSESGVKVLRLLAESQGTPLTAGLCDLLADQVTTFDVPPGSLVYTSYAACYVPMLNLGFVRGISKLRPAAVVHLEPCYEHASPDTLLGLMRRRYIEVNGYTRNLQSVLRDAESQGLIRILAEKPAIFGANPFLPASVLAWMPA
jgi:hypothetical protein